MHFTITIRRGHGAHGGRAHVPQLRLRPTSRCARLAPALDSRPRLTRVRAPPASALHPRPCYTRACAPGVLVPVGAATCLVFVSLAGLLLVRCSSSLVLLLVRCLYPCSLWCCCGDFRCCCCAAAACAAASCAAAISPPPPLW